MNSALQWSIINEYQFLDKVQAMNEIYKSTSMVRENSAARERGESVAREYERVVNTFNKILEFKEKIRLSLENRIFDLQEHLSGDADKLCTLTRNIEIYDLNATKIASNLDDLLTEETGLKDNYNKLLQGASMDMVGASVADDALAQVSSIGGESSTENLMQKRDHYLDSLSSSFQKLDDDLRSVSSLRTEMLNARSEIFRKKEQALDKKAALEENGRHLEDELDKVKSDLEVSVREEEVLTLEYAQLINRVEGCIVVSEDIDKVLFSSLTAADGFTQ